MTISYPEYDDTDMTKEQFEERLANGIPVKVINYGTAYCAIRDVLARADRVESGNFNTFPIAIGMHWDEREGLRFALRHCFGDDVVRANENPF